jgi:FAD dependent oxidoreductase TIGR03364
MSGVAVSGAALPGSFDLAVVGAGIIGLACARAAALRGLRVAVIDRDAQANGASVRNFGFITVTGQERGATWQRARRTCEIWRRLSAEADIPIVHRGLWLLARRAESLPLLDAFIDTEMGEGCEILSAAQARARCAQLGGGLKAVLYSGADIRVESREAIPKVAAWLQERLGVTFLRRATVQSIAPPQIETSRGTLRAGRVVVCPGDDLSGLYPERIARYEVTRCRLQMLRLASPGFRLPAALMSELGLLRYAGYAALPAAAALRARLEREQREYLEHGIHLIVVQSADGSLIVGDSHHYADTPDPFAAERVDQLILDEFRAATGLPAPQVLQRWVGTYASAAGRTMFVDAPSPEVRLVMVTSGSGASTGFALGEEVIDDLFARSTS